mmetsp:Transcript_2610/g.1841  ORF Transcript_2610/g.1841 Transcript_2610/m.1841 type:complete len:95 (+) Transcript_2610:80-364(+)
MHDPHNNADSLNATKKFFKEMKSQSITKIMSPNNVGSTDTAKFFADLAAHANLSVATSKRPGKKEQSAKKGQAGGNFAILRGSVGGRLSKLKNK